MSATGYIQINAFTSDARLPLEDTAITITDPSGSAIAMRLTGRNGALENPVSITVPDRAASQTPNTGVVPFTTVNLYARHNGYETIEVENLQVFPGTITIQDLLLIPLAEFPDSWNQLEIFNTPAQKL